MRKHLFLTAFCAGCFALGAQAQLHSGTSTEPNTSQDSSSKPSTWDRIKDLAATGRASQHEVRASQLTSADVKSNSGESVGTISDVIINPSSGKVDFAVISLSGSTGTASSPTTGRTGTSAPTSGTANSSSSATAGSTRQVAVPWTLLRPANTGSSTTASGMGQTFTYSGDTSKLQSAPAFDSTTDLTKPGWLQSIFSYFGINSGSATGGATSPGSSSSGSSSGSRSYPNGNPSNNP